MRGKWLIIAPLAVMGMVLFTFLGGFVVKALWNWLLPPLFGWHTIGFWQALGLLVLCRILFGGLGLHRSAGSRAGQRIRERWHAMTPEDRERLREGIKERWGWGPPAAGTKGQESNPPLV